MWKRKHSNLIVAAVLSLAYFIVTLLNVIGPLHVNAMGEINEVSSLAGFSIFYLSVALAATWGAYFLLRDKPKYLFFTLMIMGICIIIFQNFIWAWWGTG